MRGMGFAILAAGALLALPPAALAQQNQGQGWGGALDQLNRAVNPNANPDDRSRDDRSGDDRSRGDRRYEGSSDGERRGSGDYAGYSDRDLRDRYDRTADEQRRIQRERRAMEDEMERRGMRR